MKQNGNKKRKTLVCTCIRNSGDVSTLGKKFVHEHQIIKSENPDVHSLPVEDQEIFNIDKILGPDSAVLDKQSRKSQIDAINSRPLMQGTPKDSRQKKRNTGIMDALEKIILEHHLI